MDWKTLLLTAVLLTGVLAQYDDTQGTGDEFVCESGKPADVAFFLDTSNSIWRPNFRTMLNFVQEVIDFFVIGPDNIQVSVSTFGDEVFTHFKLERYSNKEKMKHAIGRIQHRGSEYTQTHHALAHTFEKTFTDREGARPGVTKVAIIITDGRSHDPEVTKHVARKARDRGIHIITIGVGFYIDEDELRGMASRPESDNVFMVQDFAGLDRIKQLLAIKTCKVTDPPTTTVTTPTTTVATTTPTTPTTTPQPKIRFQSNTPKLFMITSTQSPQELKGNERTLPETDNDYEYQFTQKGCSPKQPLDIAFVVDEKQGGTALKKKLWKFVRNIISKLNLDEGDIRVHLIRECADVPELHLNQYGTKLELMDHLDSIRPKSGQTAGLLRAMTNKLTEDDGSTDGFTNNDVLAAKRHKVGVYITDGQSGDLYATLREAQRAKLDNDIELFAVGVTDDTSPVELKALVSCETEDHLSSVDAHSNLNAELVKVMTHRLCDVPL